MDTFLSEAFYIILYLLGVYATLAPTALKKVFGGVDEVFKKKKVSSSHCIYVTENMFLSGIFSVMSLAIVPASP